MAIEVVFVVIFGDGLYFAFDEVFWGDDEIVKRKENHDEHEENNNSENGVFGGSGGMGAFDIGFLGASIRAA